MFIKRKISPLKLDLIYSESTAQQITSLRDSTLKKGFLSSYEKIKFDGEIIFNQDTLSVKFRLKGDYNDHRRSEKWSFRCYVKEGKKLLGMHTFSLQAPDTKGGLYEWYFHELLKQEGFVGLQYQFVEFNDNNRFKGVYALEQSFDSALLTSNHQVNSPILKFDKNILINQSLLNNTLKK
jgi:hypothetical protein